MIKHILFWALFALLGLSTACNNDYTADTTEPNNDDTREIHFSLNKSNGGMTLKSAVSLTGMQWKLLCFDDEYNYQFEKAGVVGVDDDIKVSVPKGKIFRFVFLCTTAESLLPTLEDGDSYWDTEAYSPTLPLDDPMSMLASIGDYDGTLRVASSTSHVSIILAPRAARIMINNKIEPASDIVVNSVTFSNVAQTVPFFNIEPQHYANYTELSAIQRGTYKFNPEEDGSCYILPDLCRHSLGMSATLQITDPDSGTQDIPVSLPTGFALNISGGKTYYIEVKKGEDDKLSATWTTRTVSKKLVVATQNLWGKNATAAIDHFNKIEADVLCAQEAGGVNDSEVRAKGLFVHTHSNNGQVPCKIISRYPFTDITPNKYGVYIDLGDGITALVMNCHGVHIPYGPYQLNGIKYGDYPGTDDVDYVIKVNGDARKDMVEKILADFNSSTTPFVSVSGDFNEPSWLDWTEETTAADMTKCVAQWPTTHALWKGGIKGDAYRTIHPDPITHPGHTWTPFPAAEDTKDRIDLTLYVISSGTVVEKCEVLGEDASTSDVVYPDWIFDHRGVRTEFIYSK